MDVGAEYNALTRPGQSPFMDVYAPTFPFPACPFIELSERHCQNILAIRSELSGLETSCFTRLEKAVAENRPVQLSNNEAQLMYSSLNTWRKYHYDSSLRNYHHSINFILYYLRFSYLVNNGS